MKKLEYCAGSIKNKKLNIPVFCLSFKSDLEIGVKFFNNAHDMKKAENNIKEYYKNKGYEITYNYNLDFFGLDAYMINTEKLYSNLVTKELYISYPFKTGIIQNY